MSGGLARAVRETERLGADALQVFSSNPRGWARPEPDPEEECAFAAACAQQHWPLFLHAPYLVNLAAPDELVHERSLAAMAFALARGARLAAAGVVVHAGSALSGDRDLARQRTADAALALLDRSPGVDLLFELTAGGGTRAVARTVEDASLLLDACGGDERIGLCIDTCHLWAAGVDLTTDAGLRDLRSAVRSLGRNRIRLLHVNDSRDPLGSGRDRHADLGEGLLGTDALASFLRAPEWRDVTVILETPGSHERRRADLAFVRSC